jgi:hypothetical protein
MDDREELHEIVRGSLEAFVRHVAVVSWFGREHEAVSLYAFSHLIPATSGDSPLYNPTQIGIEVAVPQVEGWSSKQKAQVCKDLVIWPTPGALRGRMVKRAGNDPLAVMQ